MLKYCIISNNKMLSYRRETVRRAMSVKILSAAAQLYEKSHFRRSAKMHDLEGHS